MESFWEVLGVSKKAKNAVDGPAGCRYDPLVLIYCQTIKIAMKTFLLRNEDVERRWYLFDASDATLGKLAVRVARLLMGKDEPIYTPWIDSGHFVVITNAEKVKVTGQKETKKLYRYHTGYPGRLVAESLGQIRAAKPERIIELAVKRMLPKNRQGRWMFKRLRVYAGPEHGHEAQKPEVLALS